LIAKPEIKSLAALKGKTIRLSLAVDTISISTRKLLALNGIKDNEVSVKELVGTPARSEGYHRLGVSTDAMKNLSVHRQRGAPVMGREK
jgi:ABC-type nitrate/sulfonate/bicarbonate transport system substrate-binding protein